MKMHNMLHWMHEEAVSAGHWCNVHMLHDRHFWLYLLAALAVIAVMTALVMLASNGVHPHPELWYYFHPYGTV